MEKEEGLTGTKEGRIAVIVEQRGSSQDDVTDMGKQKRKPRYGFFL